MTGRSAGFSPLRIRAGVDADLAIGIGDARPVAHQAAGHDGFALSVYRGQTMASRQRDDTFPM